jgi:chromosome segregation ATPase
MDKQTINLKKKLSHAMVDLALLEKAGDVSLITSYEQKIQKLRDEINYRTGQKTNVKIFEFEKKYDEMFDEKIDEKIDEKNDEKVNRKDFVLSDTQHIKQENNQLKKLRKQLDELETKFSEYIINEKPESLIKTLNHYINKLKNKISKLEDEEEEKVKNSDDEKRKQRIKMLNQQLDLLNEERSSIDQKIYVITQELYSIAPEEKNKHEEIKDITNRQEDEMEELAKNIINRRALYKERYGAEPGEGICMAKVKNTTTQEYFT